MNKSLLIKFFLLFLGIAVSFGTGEAMLRIKRAVAASHVMHYDWKTGLLVMNPNSQFFDKNNCWENVIKANSEGFHDTEFNLEKLDDIFRIAIIGDSYVESYQVPIEDSFQYMLEERLQEITDKKIEVYSFGVGGTGTFTHYLYLNQYVLKYKPDLVILAFLPINDFGDDIELKSDIFDKEGEVMRKNPLTQRILENSVLYRWVKAKLDIYKSYAFSQSKATVPFDFQVFLEDYPEGWNEIWELEKKLIFKFNERVRGNGGKLLLVSLPDLWRTHPYLIERDKALSQSLSGLALDFDKPEKVLSEFSQDNNIYFLNLMAPFGERARNYEEEVFFWSCDGHWNKVGHQWAAEELFYYLNDKKELLTN